MMRPLINQLPIDLLEKIVRHYHAQGIRSTIHVSTERTAWDAIYAGVDTLAHPVIQAPVSDAYVEMMAVRRIPTVSTLTIGEAASRLVERPEHLDELLYRDTVEPEEIERLKTEQRARARENGRTGWMKVMTPIAQENLRRLPPGRTSSSAGPISSRDRRSTANWSCWSKAGFRRPTRLSSPRATPRASSVVSTTWGRSSRAS